MTTEHQDRVSSPRIRRFRSEAGVIRALRSAPASVQEIFGSTVAKRRLAAVLLDSQRFNRAEYTRGGSRGTRRDLALLAQVGEFLSQSASVTQPETASDKQAQCRKEMFELKDLYGCIIRTLRDDPKAKKTPVTFPDGTFITTIYEVILERENDRLTLTLNKGTIEEGFGIIRIIYKRPHIFPDPYSSYGYSETITDEAAWFPDGSFVNLSSYRPGETKTRLYSPDAKERTVLNGQSSDNDLTTATRAVITELKQSAGWYLMSCRANQSLG